MGKTNEEKKKPIASFRTPNEEVLVGEPKIGYINTFRDGVWYTGKPVFSEGEDLRGFDSI